MKVYSLIQSVVFTTLFISATLGASAQQLELQYAELKDDKLVVHYALDDSVAGRSYSVRLYASKDNFLNPLENVSGDVGLEVKPGPNNTIVWDVKKELGPMFEGKVSVEIKARLFIPFINTESINQFKVYKRKRKYNITWSGGTPQNVLNFDLYNREKKILSFPNIANVGTYSLEFPGHTKPKRNYRFRISDTKNKEDVVYTSSFRIKRKVPLVLKVLPTIVIGFGIYSLLKDPNEESDIPPPIKP